MNIIIYIKIEAIFLHIMLLAQKTYMLITEKCIY